MGEENYFSNSCHDIQYIHLDDQPYDHNDRSWLSANEKEIDIHNEVHGREVPYLHD